MLVFLGILSILVAVIGFFLAFVVLPAWLDGEFAVGLGFLVVGLILGTGGTIGAIKVDHKENVRSCERASARLGATTKVFGHSDCRFYDESTKRWLNEDQWVYKNLGILGD